MSDPISRTPPPHTTLLVVEDEPALRELLLESLADEGYHVIGAANGVDALKVLTAKPDGIRLLITDIRMPGMHGTELAGVARNIRPEMPVLYISGYADLSELTTELSGNVRVSFLQKPFTTDAICTRVADLLSATQPTSNP